MLKYYLITALGTVRKSKIFSFINILGLAIGVSASMVIYLLVSYHLSFDHFEKDGNRIYRVVSDFNFSGEEYHNPGVTVPMGDAVRREIPGVEEVAPIYTGDGDVKIGIPVSGKKEPVVFKNQGRYMFADAAYFNLIGYNWILGNARTSVQKPYQVVLTSSRAELYFPGLRPDQIIGREIYFNDTVRLTVSGIVKDIAANTDFTFTAFISRITLAQTSLKPYDWDLWDNTNGASQLYVKLFPGVTKAQIETRLGNLYRKYHKADPEDHSITRHRLQPLKDLHFNADYHAYDLPVANRSTLYGLLAVALFLLLLGCINFINLTTANAAKRAKEIGIRKTLGSSRKQLILQFLYETFFLTLCATLLSIALTPLILHAFSGFIPAGLHFNPAEQPGILLFLAGLLLLVTLLSGFYPALILSGYKPLLVLKNQAYNNTSKTRSAWLRKTLITTQFLIAQVFIMCTMLVSKQISYSLHKDMGFKKEAILYFYTNYYDTANSNRLNLVNRLKAIPEISMVSLCSSPPSSNSTRSGTLKYKDGKKEIETDVQQKYGDTNYIKLYGIKLLAGSNLTASDTAKALLINETYSRVLGFQQPQQVIGKYLEWGAEKLPIRGVVADFNQRSLHESIKPLIIASGIYMERNISIALRPQNASGTSWKTGIGKIESEFSSVYPGDDFDYHFFDEEIAKYYTAEQHVSGLLKWATGLAIFISCLGLLGLVIHSTTRRTKEIGIRKVLGATVRQIVAILTKEFLVLIAVAFVIATPVAWFGMRLWLENFAYRTQIGWWIFLLGGVIMIFIALGTLAFQTIRAAMANPAKSLRTE